ncbi:pilus assembly protein PilM [Alkalibaculum sporogenes]|uniref:pilus assembly protein PilM n=1 Tax=Alkalibaculum sporogenes TaxID=2655001 RepID=UPI00128C2FB1|nr:pilus assembly protein PilM [Alkalibaculum sporogenes]
MFAKEDKIAVFDIGSKNIKILTGYIKDKSISIENYEIIPTPENAIYDGKIVNKEKLIDTLTTVKVKSKDIRVVLSSNNIVLRNFDLPKMEYHEIKEAIKFEMSVLLPEQIDGYIVDANIIDEFSIDNEENIEIVMLKVQGVAIDRSIVNDYLDCFSQANYKINVLDIQSNCIFKLFSSENNYIMTKKGETIAEENLAIIDMGHEKTAVTFIEDRKILFHRFLDHGGKDITKVISQTLDLDLKTAEQWKHKNDFEFLFKESKNEVESILYNEINKIFHNITLDIYQVIEFFVSMSTKKKIDRILISGGSSLIPTIDTYIQQYVNVNTQIIDTLNNVNISKLKSPNDLSIIVNALGAFIRRR